MVKIKHLPNNIRIKLKYSVHIIIIKYFIKIKRTEVIYNKVKI